MCESPVQQGFFRSGTEQVLWRPALDRARLRRRALWSSVVPDAALYALAGLAAILISVVNAPVISVALVAGVVLLMVAVLMARHDFHRFGHDLSDRSSVWRTDRGRGEWFFRASDFTDRSPAAGVMAAQIIDAVHLCHTGPAAGWLDEAHLHDVHKLAWQALERLHAAPMAHDDLHPVLVRLAVVAVRVREANRRLYQATAATGTEEVLARLAALHDVLPAGATP